MGIHSLVVRNKSQNPVREEKKENLFFLVRLTGLSVLVVQVVLLWGETHWEILLLVTFISGSVCD